MQNLLQSNGDTLETIHFVLLFYPILYIVIMTLAVVVRFKVNYIKILRLTLDDTVNSNRLVINELQMKVTRYKKKLELNLAI